eukprot:CAMPEP_0184693606 /NCGR_PEP_ID=MMETSP0313-20130426/1782_1 /TAXON_ID=2792 /ORGANISM="Porphyridium aerugineum, Strain SAG 1380-2" /LENGTH=774 /DNA_ID=CAMNT_0027151719 /DNA_START=530 /DNA_END=2854 /DNA_ORIENTATION=+
MNHGNTNPNVNGNGIFRNADGPSPRANAMANNPASNNTLSRNSSASSTIQPISNNTNSMRNATAPSGGTANLNSNNNNNNNMNSVMNTPTVAMGIHNSMPGISNTANPNSLKRNINASLEQQESYHHQQMSSQQRPAKKQIRPGCPICFNTPKEPFVAPCGQRFCFACIARHLGNRNNCPSCGEYLTKELIQPDYSSINYGGGSGGNGIGAMGKANTVSSSGAAADLMGRANGILAAANAGGLGLSAIAAGGGLSTNGAGAAGGNRASSAANPINALGTVDLLNLNASNLNAARIAELIAVLQQKQRELENNEKTLHDALVLEFLNRARKQKEDAISVLQTQLDNLNADINLIRSRSGNNSHLLGAVGSGSPNDANFVNSVEELESTDPQFQRKKKRIDDNFPQLEERYLCYVNTAKQSDRPKALEGFANDLSNYTKYSSFKCIATLKHGSRQFEGSSGTGDFYGTNNIVSSIEFDRDSELIATAGVMKRIKIFELGNILNSRVEVHYPVREMVTRAKLSCLSWNSYIRSHLISSDYEGVLTLWDTHSCQVVAEFEEHEKRAWSVDFSTVNPTMFASASDDGRVKLWSTTQLNSITTLENRANICCVKFNPESSNHLAFGSADHHVHYYDLRFPREPLTVFRGHSKAVSYIRFLSGTEIVSASTDSTLKLWSAQPNGGLVCGFQGHKNDKNFVGLGVSNSYISCGSEDNAVYTYYKSISSPLIAHKFSGANPVTGEEMEDVGNQFVSSVCWCPKYPNTLLAANSQGIIKVLELE